MPPCRLLLVPLVVCCKAFDAAPSSPDAIAACDRAVPIPLSRARAGGYGGAGPAPPPPAPPPPPPAAAPPVGVLPAALEPALAVLAVDDGAGEVQLPGPVLERV